MKLKSWVKIGVKILLLSFIVLGLFSAVDNNVFIYNKFDLYKKFTFVAVADKDLEEKPVVIDYNYVPKNTYTGSLTGYAADCALCGGTLGCKPSYNVYKNGVTTYGDATYGNVRIVASSKSLACGSIIHFYSARTGGDTYAIVLDRGVLGTDIDILMETETDALYKIGRSKITYDVLRYGW